MATLMRCSIIARETAMMKTHQPDIKKEVMATSCRRSSLKAVMITMVVKILTGNANEITRRKNTTKGNTLLLRKAMVEAEVVVGKVVVRPSTQMITIKTETETEMGITMVISSMAAKEEAVVVAVTGTIIEVAETTTTVVETREDTKITEATGTKEEMEVITVTGTVEVAIITIMVAVEVVMKTTNQLFSSSLDTRRSSRSSRLKAPFTSIYVSSLKKEAICIQLRREYR